MSNPNDQTLTIDGWKIEYKDAKHQYWATDPETGERFRVPSASQIVKTMDLDKSGRLMGWAVKMGAEALRDALGSLEGEPVKMDGPRIQAYVDIVKKAFRKKTDGAADRGKMVHAWCEEYCEEVIHGQEITQSLPKDKATRRACQEFLKWVEAYKVKPIATEAIVFSPDNEYAGTFDLLCWLTYKGKRVLTVVDFKTSNYFNQEFLAQVACYMEAVPIRWTEHQPELGCVLMLDRRDKPDYHCEWLEGDRKEQAWNAFVAARFLYSWGRG